MRSQTTAISQTTEFQTLQFININIICTTKASNN